MELERFVQYRTENPNELTAEKLSALKQEIQHPREKILSDEYVDFKLWCRGYPSRQEAFADYIDQVLPVKTFQSVLEVGGGRTGRLSRLLAKKGYHMTCMDPLLDFTDEICGSDAEGSVRVIKEAFDYQQTPLTEYDWVVAQEPCDATEHIIRACLNQNIPFFITLCGVPHRLISGEMPEDVWKWYEYLSNIDREHTMYEIMKLYSIARVAVIHSS